MSDVSVTVENLSTDDELYFRARVEARNLPESVASGLAAWACSMESGIDMERFIPTGSADEDNGVWFFEFEA